MGKRRRVCFITGSRAEFGLMRSALEAIRAHPRLELQIIATGMHLDRVHGHSIDEIGRAGFQVDRQVAWNERSLAAATGEALAGISRALQGLGSDVALVVGDRVEAFAGASAAHLSGIVVAHVHGGDRALGQVDDALRHAITKLAHIHFPATRQSEQRLKRLGEQPWRIYRIGSPGLDGILQAAAPRQAWPGEIQSLVQREFAIILLHPVDADQSIEHRRADLVLRAVKSAGVRQILIIYPNNDPGSRGIVRRWEKERSAMVQRDLQRPVFLGLMRDAAVLVGNSSAGIIEAASFGLPVLDIGPRQLGRERSSNVTHCDYDLDRIRAEVAHILNDGHPRRSRCVNVYGQGGAGAKMADILARLQIDDRLRRKIIAY